MADISVTGRAGFIGSNLITTLRRDDDIEILPINIDSSATDLESVLSVVWRKH